MRMPIFKFFPHLKLLLILLLQLESIALFPFLFFIFLLFLIYHLRFLLCGGIMFLLTHSHLSDVISLHPLASAHGNTFLFSLSLSLPLALSILSHSSPLRSFPSLPQNRQKRNPPQLLHAPLHLPPPPPMTSSCMFVCR